MEKQILKLICFISIFFLVISPILTFIFVKFLPNILISYGVKIVGDIGNWIDFFGTMWAAILSMVILAITIVHQFYIAKTEEEKRRIESIQPYLYVGSIGFDEMGHQQYDEKNRLLHLEYEISNLTNNPAIKLNIENCIINVYSSDQLLSYKETVDRKMFIWHTYVHNNILLAGNNSKILFTNFSIDYIENNWNASDYSDIRFDIELLITYTDMYESKVNRLKYIRKFILNASIENKIILILNEEYFNYIKD